MSQKQLKTVLLSVVVIAVVLLGLFGLGSSSFFAASEQRDAAMLAATADGQTVDNQSELPVTEDGTDAKTETEIESGTVQQDAKSQTAAKPAADAKDGKETAAETDTDNKKTAGTAPVTDNAAAVPEQAAQPATENSCTISISCAALVKQLDLCDPDKKDLVPSDGWILPTTTVSFSEGETVFDVLQRVCKTNKIHMEYEDTPGYNSAYIEGIANLYEFDAGAQSGWMYKVNDWFPNYGCSQYTLQNGDVICWVYSCDLGADVGRDMSEDV